MSIHFDEQYRVVVVGCGELVDGAGGGGIVLLVVRKMDGARIRLHLSPCSPTSKNLPKMLEECTALVAYYREPTELQQISEAVSLHLPATSRIIKVCINPTENVGRAPYYFPMDPLAFFAELDNAESRHISEVFWQELAAGPDYRLMNITTEAHLLKIYEPGEAPGDAGALSISLGDHERQHRNWCSTNCLLM